jgi:hypothetical protein
MPGSVEWLAAHEKRGEPQHASQATGTRKKGRQPASPLPRTGSSNPFPSNGEFSELSVPVKAPRNDSWKVVTPGAMTEMIFPLTRRSPPRVSLSKKTAGPKTEGGVELTICVASLKSHGVDAERRQQACCYCAVGARTVDPEGPAIDELDPSAETELASFGMAAEIVMVVGIEKLASSAENSVYACHLAN